MLPAAEPATSHFLPLPPLIARLPPPPSYHLPTLITTYSHLPDRSISHDNVSMAYHRPAPIGADLSYGYDRRTERDISMDEHLDGICEALMEFGNKGGKGERRGGIVTWRGMITRIMTAPFEEREGWEMTALALDGSVYIELHDPPEVRDKRRKEQSSWAWQSYMGYAYEAYSTVSANPGPTSADDPKGWSEDVNTNVQWCNVVRSAIGDIPLCLGGEVDCVEGSPGSPHPGLEKCIELKTNKVIENQRQESVFHKKLLKHWAQSWLLGIPTVEVGFRDDAGILKSKTSFPTQAIPRFVASGPNPCWNPDPALHFLHAVSSLLVTHVLPTEPILRGSENGSDDLPPAVVWRFSFVPRRGCELWRIGNVGLVDGRWGGILPEHYVRWRMQKR